MSCRKPCKECPWITGNNHNDKWSDYVHKMENIGKIKSKKHACHMITPDTWGYKQDINDNNVCIGSQINNKN